MTMLPDWLRTLYPFESRYFQLADGKMHYVDQGSGPVVLLLHGNPTWSFYYRDLIKRLSRSHRVIAPDCLGCGLSDRTPGKHFPAGARMEHLSEFIRGLGLTSFSLVMHDWGGPIGTGLATKHPECIERIVYLNTTLTETESLPWIIKISAMRGIGKLVTRHTKGFVRVMHDWGTTRRLPREVKRGYQYPYRTRRERDAIWDFVQDIPFDNSHQTYIKMMELADDIPKLAHVPVQIIWGLKDPCFHREMLNKVAEHFPQAKILEIPDASHLVLEDAPELVQKTIEDFLCAPLAELQAERRARTEPSSKRQHALIANFLRVAESHPQLDAIINPFFIGDTPHYAHFTFKALRSLIHKYARGLNQLGLRGGDKVLMLVPGGADFLALSYAVMARGAVPFYLDPGMGRENLYRCVEEIQPDVFIGSPKAFLLKWTRKKLFTRLKFSVMVTGWPWTGTPNLSFLKKFASTPIEPVAAAPIALVAYTSGATGKPKGVIFSHEMIEEQLKIFRDIFGLEIGKKDLPLLPIFSLFLVASGICSVFPPMDSSRPILIDPTKAVRLIEDLGIQFSFGSPTLWNKISEYCIRAKITLPSIEKIFMAGAPVPKSTLIRLQSILANGTAYTPYGATEALPVTLVSSQEVLDAPEITALSGELGTFVGKPVAGVSLKIIRAKAEPIHSIEQTEMLPPRVIGEIIVRGNNVSTNYFNYSQGTELGKIREGETMWHRMGDVGYLDEAGNLYFCGRKAHMVTTAERTFCSVPVERIFNQHPQVRRSALVAFGPNREVAIVVEPLPLYWPESKEARAVFTTELRELAATSELTKSIQHFFFNKSFPVDARHNAKIFRDRLGEWATKNAKAA